VLFVSRPRARAWKEWPVQLCVSSVIHANSRRGRAKADNQGRAEASGGNHNSLRRVPVSGTQGRARLSIVKPIGHPHEPDQHLP